MGTRLLLQLCNKVFLPRGMIRVSGWNHVDMNSVFTLREADAVNTFLAKVLSFSSRCVSSSDGIRHQLDFQFSFSTSAIGLAIP